MVDIRLLIVAVDPLVRAGLATLLDGQPALQIVGQIGLADMMPAESDIYQPDVILWDLGWDAEESLILLEELELGDGEGGPAVVALVPDDEAASVAWSTGVRGLLSREVSGEQMLATVQAVKWGLVALEPDLRGVLAPAGSLIEPLLAEDVTPRELEVLRLLAEGLSNKAIAQELDISDHTVKFHVNAIMGKLGAESRTAAVVQATRLGLIVL